MAHDTHNLEMLQTTPQKSGHANILAASLHQNIHLIQDILANADPNSSLPSLTHSQLLNASIQQLLVQTSKQPFLSKLLAFLTVLKHELHSPKTILFLSIGNNTKRIVHSLSTPVTSQFIKKLFVETFPNTISANEVHTFILQLKDPQHGIYYDMDTTQEFDTIPNLPNGAQFRMVKSGFDMELSIKNIDAFIRHTLSSPHVHSSSFSTENANAFGHHQQTIQGLKATISQLKTELSDVRLQYDDKLLKMRQSMHQLSMMASQITNGSNVMRKGTQNVKYVSETKSLVEKSQHCIDVVHERLEDTRCALDAYISDVEMHKRKFDLAEIEVFAREMRHLGEHIDEMRENDESLKTKLKELWQRQLEALIGEQEQFKKQIKAIEHFREDISGLTEHLGRYAEQKQDKQEHFGLMHLSVIDADDFNKDMREILLNEIVQKSIERQSEDHFHRLEQYERARRWHSSSHS